MKKETSYTKLLNVHTGILDIGKGNNSMSVYSSMAKEIVSKRRQKSIDITV